MVRFTSGGQLGWTSLGVGRLALIFVLAIAIAALSSTGNIGTAHAAKNLCVSQTGGTINGSIVAPSGSGECLLDGVTVNGHIQVGHTGVQLIIVGGSTINGSIRSPGGTVRIKDSTVNGNIQVKDCGGAIKLENSVVNGHVKFEGNGEVVVTDNTIKGSLTLKDNDLTTESGNTVSGRTTITP